MQDWIADIVGVALGIVLALLYVGFVSIIPEYSDVNISPFGCKKSVSGFWI